MLMQIAKYCPRARPSLFTSPKCRAAIPVPAGLLRHALEQASLDPSVRQIEYRSGPEVECPPISLAGVVLRREDGPYLLRIHSTRPKLGEEELGRLNFVLARHGLRLLERDASDLYREPLFSNVRAIWSHASRHVSLMDRLKISVALEDGPQTILELETRARLTDVVASVCALACENLLRLDIYGEVLGPRTLVLGP